MTYVAGTTLVLRPPTAGEDPIELAYTTVLVELHLTQDLTRTIDTAVGVGWDLDALEATEPSRARPPRASTSATGPTHDAAVGDAGWPLRTARPSRPPWSPRTTPMRVAVGRAARGRARAHSRHRRRPGDPRCAATRGSRSPGSAPGSPARTTSARPATGSRRWLPDRVPGRRPAAARAARDGRARDGRGARCSAWSSPSTTRSRLNRVQGAAAVACRQRRRRRGHGCATADAGDGYGSRVRAERRAGGARRVRRRRPDHPVVLGSLYNGTQAPPVVVDPTRTRSAHSSRPDGPRPAARRRRAPGRHRSPPARATASSSTTTTPRS